MYRFYHFSSMVSDIEGYIFARDKSSAYDVLKYHMNIDNTDYFIVTDITDIPYTGAAFSYMPQIDGSVEFDVL